MGYLESEENMEPLKCLEMAEYFVSFCKQHNYYIIYAVVGPLEHFV